MSEEKTLVIFGLRQPGHATKRAKVFWFFFSKKNCFPLTLP